MFPPLSFHPLDQQVLASLKSTARIGLDFLFGSIVFNNNKATPLLPDDGMCT